MPYDDDEQILICFTLLLLHRTSINTGLTMMKRILRLASYHNKTITSRTTNIFTLMFWSLPETIIRRNLFSSEEELNKQQEPESEQASSDERL